MQVKREKIYKHTHLLPGDAERYRSLFESAFAEPMKRFQHGNRRDIGQERIQFATEQFANRARIANNLGTSPLNEDAQIFGRSFPQLKTLFESITTNGNVIGMGPGGCCLVSSSPGGNWTISTSLPY